MPRIEAPSQCPFCKEMLDAYKPSASGGSPSPGDITICAQCGEFLEFGQNLQLVEISPEALDSIPMEELAYIKNIIEGLHLLRNLRGLK